MAPTSGNQPRVHNFNPGPAALPRAALLEAQDEMMNFRDQGMSVMEVSHRSDVWVDTLNECKRRINELLDVPDSHHVLFLQGGASLQFAMLPMNLAAGRGPVEVIESGRWSGKKITELKIQQNVTHHVVATSEDTDFDRVPPFDRGMLDPDASYVHICSNETVGGVQWHEYPDTGSVPLVADMASDLMSRPVNVEDFGVIYGGAQKNMGPAGVTVVIMREDLIERTPPGTPTMLRYDTHVERNSMYNTPPIFPIYMVNKVMAWVQQQGGLDEMKRRNQRKSGSLYEIIDEDDFYRGAAHRDNRSIVNVTFRLPTPQLEETFLERAQQQHNLVGLKGHRSVGGCRASLYNGLPMESVEILADYMRSFRAEHS